MDKHIHDEKNGLWYERLLLFFPSYHTEPQSLCNFKTLGARTVPVSGTVSSFCVVCCVYTIAVCGAISRNIVLRE